MVHRQWTHIRFHWISTTNRPTDRPTFWYSVSILFLQFWLRSSILFGFSKIFLGFYARGLSAFTIHFFFVYFSRLHIDQYRCGIYAASCKSKKYIISHKIVFALCLFAFVLQCSQIGFPITFIRNSSIYRNSVSCLMFHISCFMFDFLLIWNND